jgi:hypothetical protein
MCHVLIIDSYTVIAEEYMSDVMIIYLSVCERLSEEMCMRSSRRYMCVM